MAIQALVLAFALAYAPPLLSQPPGAQPQPAPPLPFRYVGRLVHNGKSEVLLMRGRLLHSVAEGDEIDGEYRVERITGSAIRFTYLPAGMQQSLDLTAGR